MASKFRILKTRKWWTLAIIFLGVIIGAPLARVMLPTGQVTPGANALSNIYMNKFSQNDIMFYDPEECLPYGTSTGSFGSSTISGTEAEQKIWTGLTTSGISEEVAAGIMGNMWGESHYNPAVFEEDYRNANINWETNPIKGHGVGLAQWSGERRVNFYKYMKQNAPDLVEKYLKNPTAYTGNGDDFIKKAANNDEVNRLYAMELNFLKYEIQNNNIYSQVLQQTTVEDAAWVFAEKVEVCSACHNKQSKDVQNRISKAKEVYQNYSGKTDFGMGTEMDASTTVEGSRVTIIGDSITAGLVEAKLYDAKLPGADITAQVGKHWSMQGGAGNGGGDSGLKILENLANSGQVGSVLVFALGTNDTDGISTSDMEKMLNLAKDASKIVLVTNWSKGALDKNNEMFKEYATKDNRIVVADWAALVAENPNYVEDGTHPGAEGNEAYMNMIMQAIGAVGSSRNAAWADSCCDPRGMPSSYGMYSAATYDLTDEELRKVAAMALKENGGTILGMRSEASQMANLFESPDKKGTPGDASGFMNFIATDRWYAGTTAQRFAKVNEVTQEQIDAVRDVLVNGNRMFPTQIVEHDCIEEGQCNAGVRSIEVDGKTYTSLADRKNKSLYKRGETIIYNHTGEPWVFWDWADPETKQGDPFGYKPNNPPSGSEVQSGKGTSATQVSGSSVTWSDGWIAGGLDGYVKDDAAGTPGLDPNVGKDFTTQKPGGQGVGPNKILLHATEGLPTVSDGSIIGIYKNPKTGKYTPPHFTVDIKNKKVYQHSSILKASGAVKDSDDMSAGVQIEIVGCDTTEAAQTIHHLEWDLTSSTAFSDEDFLYLAELMNAISVETGIPLSSTVDWADKDEVRFNKETEQKKFDDYQGVLGHKHAPKSDHSDISEAVWKRVEKALSNYTGAMQSNDCVSSFGSGDVGSLQAKVLEFAWPTPLGNDHLEKTQAYIEAVKRSPYKGGCEGADCGAFVTILMHESGWDPNYNSGNGNTTTQFKYLQANWIEITDMIRSKQTTFQPGDVFIEIAHGHTLVYVGEIPGFSSTMASASLCKRAPMAEHMSEDYYIGQANYHFFRKK